MKKILLLTSEGKNYGGVEKNIEILSTGLKNAGYEVLILCFKKEKSMIENAISCNSIFNIYKEIFKFNPHVIYSYQNISNIISMSLRWKYKIICSLHIPSTEITRKIDFLNLFLFKFLPNKITVPSTKDPLLISNKNTLTLFNPIDVKK